MMKFSILKVLCTTLGLATLATLPQLQVSGQAITDNQDPSKTGRVALSVGEKEELGRIYKKVINVNEEVDAKTHASFWSIVNRHGGSLAEIEGIETKLRMHFIVDSVMTSYQKLFYQDALISIKTGKPFTSVERSGWNTRISQDRVSKNNELMTRIAAKKPIPTQGGSVVLTSAMATEILTNMDLKVAFAKQKVDILYNKNYASSTGGHK